MLSANVAVKRISDPAGLIVGLPGYVSDDSVYVENRHLKAIGFTEQDCKENFILLRDGGYTLYIIALASQWMEFHSLDVDKSTEKK